MDNRSIQMFMNMLMAAQGQGLPGYESGRQNPWDYSQMASLMPEQDSFFGPIGNMVAGMIPGMTVTGIDGNPTPVFKTNFRGKVSGLTGLQLMYAQQNAKAYGAASRGHTARLREDTNKFSSGLVAAGEAMGIDPKYLEPISSLMSSEAGAGIAQQMVNSMLGYDRGAAVAVANQKSPFMAASYLRSRKMQDMVAPDHTGDMLHPAARFDPLAKNQKRGVDNVFDLYNPFGDEATTARSAMATLAEGTTSSLMWDGLKKKLDVHGASEQYVAEIVADALAAGDDGINIGGDSKFSLTNAVEQQRAAQARVDEINNRKGDWMHGEKAGVNQLRQELDEANKRGDKDAAQLIENQLQQVLTEDLKPATDALDEVSKKTADGIRPLVEAVTGVTDSLRDFYGSEDEAKRALDDLTGGQGRKDKAVADRMRDQITEIKALGAMAGLDPTVTGSIFKMSSQIGGGIGGSALGKSGGTGAAAAAWTADLLKGLIGAGLDPNKAGDMINAHAAGQEAWNNSLGKRALTMLTHAKENNLFNDMSDTDYQELTDLMTSGSYQDLQEAIKRFGKKYMGSEAEFREWISNDQNVAEAYEELSQEGKAEVENRGVKARGAEMDRARDKAGYTVEQRQQRRALKEAGVSETEIDNAVAESDFMAMREYLGSATGDKDALAALDSEYQAALKKVGGNPGDPKVQAKARKMAVNSFYRSGAADMLDIDQQDDLQQTKQIRRSQTLNALDMFEGRKDGLIDAKKGGFFESVKAADDKGLTRTSMSEATKNMASALRKMGGAKTKDGKAVDAKAITSFEKQYKQLMDNGKFEEARNLSEQFFGNLDELTQKRIKGTLGKNTYRTVDNINQQQRARESQQEIAENAEVAKIMKGLNPDDQRRLQQLYKMRATEADPAKKEEIVKQIKEMEDKAKAADQSDGEKIVQAIQDKDWAKLFTTFKSGNVTMEQFLSSIRRIIGVLDGTTVSAKEAAAAAKAGATSDGRNTFLTNATTLEDRLAATGDKEDAQNLLDALNGGHVRSHDTEKWRGYMAKAAKGDRSAYEKAIGMELDFIDDSKDTLQDQYDKYAKEAGGKSVEELENVTSANMSESDRKKLQKQLDAARQRDKTQATLASLSQKEGELEAVRKDVSNMSDAQFKEQVDQASESVAAYGVSPRQSGGGGGQGGGAGQADVSALIQRMERLCQLLQQYIPNRGSNGGIP